jgi:RHS repeat-associated protein
MPVAKCLAYFDYYPYGEDIAESASAVSSSAPGASLQPYRFNGKESQEFAGLPYLDYGARYYHPLSSRWTTMDPMAEKYYSVSPYAFCSGNPVNFVDTDGRKLYFANNVSQQFKEQFAKTIQFMNSKGTSGDIAKLHASDNVYYISEAGKPGGNQFHKGERTIFWDPYHFMQTGDGIQISPATMLAHEANHAKRYDETQSDVAAKASFENDTRRGSDPEYGTLEERRVIEGTEQDAARKHGEIGPDQVTRKTHKEKSVTWISTFGSTPEMISEAIFKHNNDLF